MRAFITCAVLTAAALTVSSASAQPISGDVAGLVDSWYLRYLGRHADPAGLHDHVRAIRHGTPLDVVEAAILGSPEYYVRNGNTPEGFVAALYRDVLGRRADRHEFNHDVRHVLEGNRHTAIRHVLNERSPAVIVASPPPVVYSPAPVYVAPRPVVVVPGGIGHSHRPAPVHVVPAAPAISIRLNFGR